MIVCLYDFETSGLDPETDKVIEVGAILVDWDTQACLQLESFFVEKPGTLTDEIIRITGITDAMLKQYGLLSSCALDRLLALMRRASIIVGHNAKEFDNLFLAAWQRSLVPYFPELLMPADKIWLDTLCDIEYPEHITTRNLLHLAAEHGFMPPAKWRHRAIGDVMTTWELLAQYDIECVCHYAAIPTVHLQTFCDFDHNQLAKDRRYRWAPKQKIWWKSLKQHLLAEEQAYWAGLNFRTKVLDKKPEE